MYSQVSPEEGEQKAREVCCCCCCCCAAAAAATAVATAAVAVRLGVKARVCEGLEFVRV